MGDWVCSRILSQVVGPGHPGPLVAWGPCFVAQKLWVPVWPSAWQALPATASRDRGGAVRTHTSPRRLLPPAAFLLWNHCWERVACYKRLASGEAPGGCWRHFLPQHTPPFHSAWIQMGLEMPWDAGTMSLSSEHDWFVRKMVGRDPAPGSLGRGCELLQSRGCSHFRPSRWAGQGRCVCCWSHNSQCPGQPRPWPGPLWWSSFREELTARPDPWLWREGTMATVVKAKHFASSESSFTRREQASPSPASYPAVPSRSRCV